MKLFQAYCLLILLSLTASSTATLVYAKEGCNDMCGNVTIPYPFGIGPRCSLNHWYNVECNSSTPYLLALNHLQVLSVSLYNQTVVVNTPTPGRISSDRQNSSSVAGSESTILSIDLDERSPFLFSKSKNKFVFEGCGVAIMMENGSVVTGCSATCGINDTVRIMNRNKCYGVGCCESSDIPGYLKSYTIKLKGIEDEDGGGCGSGFLVDRESYDQQYSGISSFSDHSNFIPVSLLWTLTDSNQISCCNLDHNNYSNPAERYIVDMFYGTPLDTWKCAYSWSTEVNPYLIDGCDDGRDGQCKKCQESGGFCIYIGDPGYETFSTCKYHADDRQKKSKTSLGVILGVSISVGVIFIVVISYMLYKVIQKAKEKRQRKMFFKRNGGLLLKQQQEADSSLVDKTVLFTSRELEKATDNFNENRILGRGGQGTVYKGMLVDGRIVAVKKSKILDESQLEPFINEVVVLSQVNHRNVVKLFGCCLETDVPLLVSEFIPNGTLYDLLHNEADELLISLNMRLQIATEAAAALAYLHSATSIPIYHRDIKTSNILLDEKYRAKISDFGTSRFISIEQTHLTTLVKGTFGYLDPEYFQSSQFTEKSDVYSFGVVLIELLTREKPISITRFGEYRSLVTHFMLAIEEGRVMSVFDELVVKEGTRNELQSLANLAMRCINLKGKYRPTMNEVDIELETIRTLHIPSSV